MSRDEIVEKYRYLAGQRLDGDRVERIIALVEGLDRATTLESLLEALVAWPNNCSQAVAGSTCPRHAG